MQVSIEDGAPYEVTRLNPEKGAFSHRWPDLCQAERPSSSGSVPLPVTFGILSISGELNFRTILQSPSDDTAPALSPDGRLANSRSRC
jgi:hypothetical protein